MQLKNYFENQKKTFVNEDAKLNIYHDFLDKKFKKQHSYSRSFLHVRSLVYTTLVVFFLFGIYGSEIFYQDGVKYNYDGVKITPENGFYVNADYIAKIVDFVGNFKITNQNGQEIQTSNIGDGDTVILYQNTQLKFNISDGTEAKLVGPAKFSVYKKGENQYKLTILEGNYLEMKSLKTVNVQDVEVAIQDMILHKDDKKPMNFQFIKNKTESVIKNNGSKLSVYKNSNIKQPVMKISNKQIAMVTDKDISLINDSKDFKDALSKKQIIQRFVFEKKDVSDTKTIKVDKETYLTLVSTGVDLLQDDGLSIDTEIVNDLAGVIKTDDKKVLTDAKFNQLKALLYKGFVDMDVKNISDSLANNDQNSIDISLLNFNKRISQIYGVFDKTYSNNASTTELNLRNIQKYITDIKGIMKANYYIPDTYITELDYIYSQISKVLKTIDLAINSGKIDNTKILP